VKGQAYMMAAVKFQGGSPAISFTTAERWASALSCSKFIDTTDASRCSGEQLQTGHYSCKIFL